MYHCEDHGLPLLRATSSCRIRLFFTLAFLLRAAQSGRIAGAQIVRSTEEFLGALSDTSVDHIQIASNLSFPLATQGLILYNRTLLISGGGTRPGSVHMDFGISEAVVVVGAGSNLTLSQLIVTRTTPLPQPSNYVTRYSTGGMLLWPAVVLMDGSQVSHNSTLVETPAPQADAVAYTKSVAALFSSSRKVIDDVTLSFGGYQSWRLPLFDHHDNLTVGWATLATQDTVVRFTPQSVPQGTRSECLVASHGWWSWGAFLVGVASATGIFVVLSLVVYSLLKLRARRAQQAFVKFDDQSGRVAPDLLKASVIQP